LISASVAGSPSQPTPRLCPTETLHGCLQVGASDLGEGLRPQLVTMEKVCGSSRRPCHDSVRVLHKLNHVSLACVFVGARLEHPRGHVGAIAELSPVHAAMLRCRSPGCAEQVSVKCWSGCCRRRRKGPFTVAHQLVIASATSGQPPNSSETSSLPVAGPPVWASTGVGRTRRAPGCGHSTQRSRRTSGVASHGWSPPHSLQWLSWRAWRAAGSLATWTVC